MIPEKPKRTISRSSWKRSTLTALLLIPLPLLLLAKQRLGLDQLVDMLLIGFMLCCTVYLVYQILVGVLLMLAGEDSVDET